LAEASLKVSWDCYLPASQIDCAQLVGSLTTKIPFVKVVQSAQEADVAVVLKSVPAESGTRFIFDFIGRSVSGYRAEVHMNDKIPDSVDSGAATVRIMTRLERGLADFMEQRLAGDFMEGQLMLQVSDPEALPFSGRTEQEALQWYVAPTISGVFSNVQGVGINATGNASISFNYSGDRWRYQGSAGISYNEQSQPVAGTTETASISFFGANATNILSWSVPSDKRLSVALLLSGEKNPQANYNLRGNGSLGVEFDVVPRQTSNQANAGLRCAVGPEFQRYDTVNIQNRQEQWLTREMCDIFVSWHFPAFDVSASFSETAPLNNIGVNVGGSLSLTWRITDNLLVSPWISAQAIEQPLNAAQPTTVSFSDPRQEVEASMRAAIQQTFTSPFGIQSGLSIRYSFGNGSLNSEDQRWKGTSNLR
jgi:hypothetical protein